MSDVKVRENRLRRMAERQWMRIEKCRRRDPHARDYGGYELLKDNVVILGCAQYKYDATLDEIEWYLTTSPEDRQKHADKIRKEYDEELAAKAKS